MRIEVDLENVTFKVITKEGAKCGFCNKELKPIGLDYLYANIDQDMIEYERCNCSKATAFWKRYDLKQNELEKQRKLRELINRIYKDTYMKKRLQKCNFKNFHVTDDNKDSIEMIKKYTELCIKDEMKNGIIIYGNIGYENTYIVSSMANKIIENNKIVLLERTSSIMDRIKESFNKEVITEVEIIELYSNVDMLIIDDFGSETISKWALEKLYKIINNRYENELPLVITTRYNKEELLEQMSIENQELAEEFIQILYRMCYGISLIKDELNAKEKVSISDQTNC